MDQISYFQIQSLLADPHVGADGRDYLAAGGSNYVALTKGSDVKTGPSIQQVLEFIFRSHKTINYISDDRLTLLNNNL